MPSNAAYVREWMTRPGNRARVNAKRRNGPSRAWHLKKKYGITLAQQDKMLADQNGLCLVCGDRPATHVDHCHSSGKIRGMLCHCCNCGIGMLRDSEMILRSALAYLAKHT